MVEQHDENERSRLDQDRDHDGQRIEPEAESLHDEEDREGQREQEQGKRETDVQRRKHTPVHQVYDQKHGRHDDGGQQQKREPAPGVEQALQRALHQPFARRVLHQMRQQGRLLRAGGHEKAAFAAEFERRADHEHGDDHDERDDVRGGEIQERTRQMRDDLLLRVAPSPHGIKGGRDERQQDRPEEIQLEQKGEPLQIFEFEHGAVLGHLPVKIIIDVPGGRVASLQIQVAVAPHAEPSSEKAGLSAGLSGRRRRRFRRRDDRVERFSVHLPSISFVGGLAVISG